MSDQADPNRDHNISQEKKALKNLANKKCERNGFHLLPCINEGILFSVDHLRFLDSINNSYSYYFSFLHEGLIVANSFFCSIHSDFCGQFH